MVLQYRYTMCFKFMSPKHPGTAYFTRITTGTHNVSHEIVIVCIALYEFKISLSKYINC